MRLIVLMLCAAVLGSATAQAREQHATALMRGHRCYVCHDDREAGAGPAFVDISAHYKGNPNAVAIVAAFVRRGAHGNGPWHMPPHPEVSAADAKAMARYILSLEPRRIRPASSELR